jgi:DNA processing protein
LARAAPKAPRKGATVRLNRRQRLAWLRLIRSENVGPATFRALVNEFGGAEAAIDAVPMLSRRGGRTHDIRLYREDETEEELAAAEALGAQLVAIGEPGYPPALGEVDAPPPLLYVKGNLDLAAIPIVAIVGARNGSAVGQKFTRGLATDLGLEGFVIASGLARGIDTAAHLASLEAAPSPCSLAASTMSTRRRTRTCSRRSERRVCSSASVLPASRRAARISHAATA